MQFAGLGPSDPAPVEVINPRTISPLLITGDHAGNAVPAAMRGLGLPASELERHIAWDIGAAGVARKLATMMEATAVLAVYSRLLIDPNRPLSDPGCVPKLSDGTPIPANVDLSDGDIEARANAFYWPYHRVTDEHIGRLRRAGQIPAIVTVHTFTPALNKTGAQARPWHIGVLYSRDERLPAPLMKALKAEEGVVVGDNEPYSGVTHGYALKIHGLAHGLPHVELELRQDLVADDAGQEKWADLLARMLTPILDMPDMKTIVHI
jgi:predicted N-formylglutamate amidohydrolase